CAKANSGSLLIDTFPKNSFSIYVSAVHKESALESEFLRILASKKLHCF
ncbi:MAG: hypothetical protein QG663_1727, partial [Thermodesulfobacteriota bacterium]|nr:hypothetical protein [Thermodesulfobacteriota bacterium]